ncbi:hypothetical protein [Blastopirellula retiformator]|uniref:Tetratricopeptide repeat protein n=1 Tax=Blastopirellula retiformator TaxID=2527970 RepID=A0A5C5VM72_9BACT|nr:hypothetical protein [Blastopirellula retiformator]TWT39080.1 hypothetical protein Enr8_07750 [Blastopirellula retiformator]
MNHRNLNVLVNRHFTYSYGQPTDPIDDLISAVDDLLKMDCADEALNLLRSTEHASDPRLTNARGVCQMRLGLIDAAVATYRTLVLEPVGSFLAVRNSLHDAYKTNLATALMLKGNVPHGEQVLEEIRNKNYPMIDKLRSVVAVWRRELSPWENIEHQLGFTTFRPVSLPFKPGELV